MTDGIALMGLAAGPVIDGCRFDMGIVELGIESSGIARVSGTHLPLWGSWNMLRHSRAHERLSGRGGAWKRGKQRGSIGGAAGRESNGRTYLELWP